MYLVDTNVWVELLLEQEKAKEVRRFLEKIDPKLLYMTEFTLYSINIVLVRLKKMELLRRFVRDTIPNISLVRLFPEDLDRVLQIVEGYNLDFDDAYQYAATEKYDLTLVSFDSDFDRTERGRMTPAEVLSRGVGHEDNI